MTAIPTQQTLLYTEWAKEAARCHLFECSYEANYYLPDGSIQFKTSMTGFIEDTKG
jgi:uncharacterized protein (DUF427 family)